MAISSFFLLLILATYATACDRCLHHSKAAYFSSSSSASAGACGYGPLALGFNKGFVAAGGPSLYRDGIGCGGCFQVRCKDPRLCSTKGVAVVVTDQHAGNGTDLVLNAPAFIAMARSGSEQGLKEAGLVDVEYKRVPCAYKRNLAVRVEEGSRRPSNLTIKIMYQGGQTDIVGVDVARVGSGAAWQYLARAHGPVWSTDRAPAGPLQMRMVVTGGYDGKWVWAQRQVLPSDWRAGAVYDAGVQITDIAQEGCSPCDDDEWM